MEKKIFFITNILLSNCLLFGQYNTATGTNALNSNTGSGNTATGYYSMYNNTSGYQNSAHGSMSLYNTSIGFKNSGYGYSALFANIDGHENCAIGYSALNTAAHSIRNTAAGAWALGLTDNYYSGVNAAMGFWALVNNTTGAGNVGIGWATGANNQTGDYNTYVGFYADANIANSSYRHSTAIGAYTLVTGSDMVRLGDGSVSSIGGTQPWTAISDKRLKHSIKQNIPGLAFIDILKPVTYYFDLDAYYEIVLPEGRKGNFKLPSVLDSLRQLSRKKKETILYTGFLAQDVEAAAKSIGYDFSGIDAPRNKNDVYGLRYTDFVMPLVNGAKELNELQSSLNTSMDELRIEIKSAFNEVSELENISKDAYITQSTPNPVTSSTRITYYVPHRIKNSAIIFFNSSGQIVKQFKAVTGVRTELILRVSDFISGTYSYSLIAGGQEIGTKKMIVIK